MGAVTADEVDVSIPLEAAEEVCATVWPDRETALAEARRLRAAGWIVPLMNTQAQPPAVRAVATVYRPVTFAVVGEIRYAEP